MSLTGKIEFAGLTDVGMKRTHNEDSIFFEPDLGLAVLADGMGGYKGGEVASAIAINTIISRLEKIVPDFKFGEVNNITGIGLEEEVISEVLQEANKAIYDAAQSQSQYQGMGTTIVLAFFHNNRVTIAHVGDSRLYRIRGEEIEQITTDHTLLQELIERGFYTKEEARRSFNKNLVTRALGIDVTVQADLQELPTLPGDIYLLCSDGLNDMVEDIDIYLTLQKYNDNLSLAVAELVKMANNNGGRDNVSVVVARPLKPYPINRNWTQKVSDWFF